MAVTENPTPKAGASTTALADAAVPANVAPATAFSTSGAPVQIVPDVDPAHPAVDNDPRAGTTIGQNKIEFNDPTIPGADAVAKRLGMKDTAQSEAELAKIDAAAKPDPDKPKA